MSFSDHQTPNLHLHSNENRILMIAHFAITQTTLIAIISVNKQFFESRSPIARELRDALVRLTLRIGRFTVTIIVKRNNRHLAK